MVNADEDIVDYYQRFLRYKRTEYVIALLLIPNVLFLCSLGWIPQGPLLALFAAPPGESIKTCLLNWFLCVFLSDFVGLLHAFYVATIWCYRFGIYIMEDDITRWMYNRPLH